MINFYNEMTGLVDKVRVNVVYLLFSKTFDTVFHKITIEKWLIYQVDEQTVRWIEN